MKNMQKSKNKQNKRLATDFQDNASCSMLWAFSDAYLPAYTTKVSLVNLPIKKAGIIYLAFSFDMPAAKKRGVVGRGNKE